jgi:hypothetical protein
MNAPSRAAARAPAVVAALVWLAPPALAGQAPATATQETPPGGSGASETAYEAPRTPWGDPDLQGSYTNVYESGTPMERPVYFEGRRREDVTGDELREYRRLLREQSLVNFAGGLHAPDHFWQENYDLERGGQAWLIVDPPDYRIPPRTAEAEARAAAQRGRDTSGYSHMDLGLYGRCITRGFPGSMMPTIYGSHYQIVQSPSHVAIRYEMVHETRIIPLDRGAQLGSDVRQYMGAARGWWEGDTLVVETTNFKEESTYDGANADTLRIIERFTRTAPDKTQWSVTIDDPSTWTRPWTFSMPLTMSDATRVFEYSCHEGNFAMVHYLEGARAQEEEREAWRQKGIAIRPREVPSASEFGQ